MPLKLQFSSGNINMILIKILPKNNDKKAVSFDWCFYNLHSCGSTLQYPFNVEKKPCPQTFICNHLCAFLA